MPNNQRRQIPRKPLTETELAAGMTYYSADDYAEIFKNIPLHPKADRQYLQDKIDIRANEYCVNWHEETKHPQKGDLSPAVAARRFKAIANQLIRTRKMLEALPVSAITDLLLAAEDLTLDGEILPGLKYQHSNILRNGLAYDISEKELNNIQYGLKWLKFVADKAATDAAEDKTPGGNRSDPEEYEFVNELVGIYKEAVGQIDIRMPWYDLHSDEWKNPELLNYIRACQAPLGTRRSSLKATNEFIRRAKALK